MKKKYIVRLRQEERDHLEEVIRKLSGSPQKVRSAWILLKADANGPGWTDQRLPKRICAAQEQSKRSGNVSSPKALKSLWMAGNGRIRLGPGSSTATRRAEVIALRLGELPSGYSNWSLRLLAERVVELGFVEAVSHETLRQTLKKTASPDARSNIGSFRRRRLTVSS